jgi:signal transduction histidine kinase
VAVSDNGPGLADHLRQRVFEPFYTTKPAGSGHPGLGLSLAHETVVVGYAGEITVESEEGAGSTFTVRLPAG